jgi:hypothetical protein
VNTTYRQLKHFGEIHYNDKRVVVVTLQEATSDDKVRRYLSFHEHFWNAEEKKLFPRKRDGGGFDKVISFTLPWKKEVVAELAGVIDKIASYTNAPAKPAQDEDAQSEPF